MENTSAVPQKLLDKDPRQGAERRKENRHSLGGLQVEPAPVSFQDRRAGELRRAADRHERAGSPVLAQMFRNEAWLAECENGSGLYLEPSEKVTVL